jgi:hypothetical protein
MFREISGVSLVGVLSLCAGADVVTNVWINPAGRGRKLHFGPLDQLFDGDQMLLRLSG